MIKGILFDKDGTLIEFHSLWISAAIWSMSELIKVNNLSQDLHEYILELIGVVDGKIISDAPLAYKTYEEISQDITNCLAEKEIYLESKNIENQIKNFFEQFVESSKYKYQEITDTKQLLTKLKEMNIILGVATADTKQSTIDCLEKIDVLQEFDYIGTDDGIMKPKPNSDMLLDFMENYSLKANEIMIVGDTYNDILFAKNNGAVAVGVLSGVSKVEDFKDEADFVIGSIVDLPSLISK